MKLGSIGARHLMAATLLVCVAVLMAGCGSLGGDQNTFAPEGDVAKQQKDLFLLVLWPALVIGVLVFAGLIYILVRYRRRAGDPIPEQVHGNTRLELAWTIAPTILLLIIAVPTIMGIIDLGEAAGEDALDVTVNAFQWDWSFEYPELLDDEGNPLVSDEMYIPVDREIDVSIESADVIHSFWVPKLAGKQDAVPGRTNKLKFTAEKAGTYAGQCAEFCGISHPVMRFETIALEPGEFDAWVQEQLGGAAATAGTTEGQ